MRINFRFLTYLVILLVVVTATLFGINQYQLSRSSARLFDEAQKAKAESRYRDAEALYVRYLAFDNSSVDALVELGRIRLAYGDASAAYFNFEKALRLAGDRSDVRESLAELSLTLERYADAKSHADVLAQSSPNNAKYQWLLGKALQD